MANKITGTTDTSGNISVGTSVISNSSRPILLVGVGVDATKEVVFSINGTTDATTHFGANSPFVNAVKTLIRNGVNNIKGMCISEFGAEKPYTTKASAYDAAYAKSLLNNDIVCIIIDDSDSTLHAGIATHLANAEDDDMFRYAVVGASSDTTTVAAVKTLAAAIDSDRVFIGFPNMVDDTGAIMDGVQTAAGIAAAICTETDDPALPVGGVSITGFGGIAMKLTNSEKDELQDAGVVALYPDGSMPTIYRLVTSKQKSGSDDSIWHDATTRMIADNVLMSVMTKLRANYKRTKNVSRVLNSIKTDVIGILDDKEGLEIIKNFDKSTVSVIIDPDDIYGALVDYEFQVITPLYTITITQHIKV